MAWDDGGEDWEKYVDGSSDSDAESSEDEAIKQLRAEAEAAKNKVKKLSLAERKAKEEEERKAAQAKIDAETRELRRRQQEVKARLGPGATAAQIDKAMQEASALEDVRDLFAVPDADAAGGGAAAAAEVVPGSFDVALLDLIGEEEHRGFGEKLGAKLEEMSTGPYIVAFVETLLKKLEPTLQSNDYNAISKVANVMQNLKTQQQKAAMKKTKSKKKEKPKLNTGVKSVAKGGFEDFMGDDGAGNYYSSGKDYGW